METRKSSKARTSSLPVDYLRMVTEVFNTNFDAGLKALTKHNGAKAFFEVNGNVYPSEVVLAVSLMQGGQLAATTVYASCDYDPKASAPTIEDLLSHCVDTAGILFLQLLTPEKPENLERLAHNSLSALEDVPYDWTAFKVERFKVYLKIDKANPSLDRLADEWLAKHDPHAKALSEEEEEETKSLFVTGEAAKKPSSGTIH